MVLYGLRGVGKTVLLSEFARTAMRANWITAKVEAGAGKSLSEAIGEALHGPLVDIVRPNAGTRLHRALKTALSFKASYDSVGTWNFGWTSPEPQVAERTPALSKRTCASSFTTCRPPRPRMATGWRC